MWIRVSVILTLLLAARPAAAGPRSNSKSPPPGAVEAGAPTRTFTLADFKGLNEDRIKAFLKARHALLSQFAKGNPASSKLRDLCHRAVREPVAAWGASAQALEKDFSPILGMSVVDYLELHATVAAAYTQFAAVQGLKDLESPTAQKGLGEARKRLADSKASDMDKEKAKIDLARAEDSAKRLKNTLISGFPAALLEVVGKHDRELLAALEGDDDEESQTLGPSDPTAEDKGAEEKE
jgi:hypothetical protein